MKTAFITGTSSGLGHGLAEYLSGKYWTVFGCSRRGCDLPGVHDRICDLTVPALERLREARGTEAMPDPSRAAQQIISVLPRLKDWPSGSFVDIREMIDPEAYARLFANSVSGSTSAGTCKPK